MNVSLFPQSSEENKRNLIPALSLLPGSVLWEKTSSYLSLSAKPVMYHYRGRKIQMSLTLQVSGLLPLTRAVTLFTFDLPLKASLHFDLSFILL